MDEAARVRLSVILCLHCWHPLPVDHRPGQEIHDECVKPRLRMQQAVHRANNLESVRERARLHNLAYREEAFFHYGDVCTCCGESRFNFLTIDHINNDGAEHRRTMVGDTYRWLSRNDYPDTFQTLCMNCNWARGKRGACPHEYD